MELAPVIQGILAASAIISGLGTVLAFIFQESFKSSLAERTANKLAERREKHERELLHHALRVRLGEKLLDAQIQRLEALQRESAELLERVSEFVIAASTFDTSLHASHTDRLAALSETASGKIAHFDITTNCALPHVSEALTDAAGEFSKAAQNTVRKGFDLAAQAPSVAGPLCTTLMGRLVKDHKGFNEAISSALKQSPRSVIEDLSDSVLKLGN